MDTSAPPQKFETPAPNTWCRNVLGPKCLRSEVFVHRFGERFCDGQYNLVSFLFAVLLLTVPPVPSHL